MPKWSEAAKQRDKQRRVEREREKAKFPRSLLFGDKFHIRLEAGDPSRLWMRHFGDWEDYEYGDSREHPWQECSLDFRGDLHALGHFIHALTCRYNDMADQINEQASRIEVKKLAPIPFEA